MRSLFDVSEKVAIITGGRRGIGKAITLGLAEAGAKVAVIAKTPEAEELKKEVNSLIGADIFYLSADLSYHNQRQGLIKRVLKHFGKLDILINNAGVQKHSPILEYTMEQWRQDISLLLTAVLDLTQQAGRAMIDNGGGKIINISSISSFQGANKISGYVAAKHGLIGLTKCAAVELAPYNIQVNAIAPGFIDTEMLHQLTSDPVRLEDIKARIPMHRIGTPKDLLGTVLFLASDASNYVTGTTIPVDGGWLSR